MNSQILVVDDELKLHDTYKRTFRKDISVGKYQFSFAADGQQALEIFEKQRDIAAIFLDLEMPNMNGIEFMAQLMDVARHKPLQIKDRRFYKIVIVSAYDDMSRIRKCMNYGASEFIVKNPIDWDELRLILNKMLNEVKTLRDLERWRADETQKRQEAERKLGQMRGILNGTMGNPLGGSFGA